MSVFKIITLGCGSAKPSLRHQPSCTIVNHNENLFMIDCGEGAQLAFQRARLKFSRLSDIFITHLHGDHVLGLPGFLSTLALSGMGGSINIHTFKEGKEILSQILSYFCRETPFEINFNIIEPEEKVIFENNSLSVRTIPLKHRIPDVGFIFEEKPHRRHINRSMVDFHNVPVFKLEEIRRGADFIKSDGTVIPNEILTTDADPALSYAHISDTVYMPGLADKIGPVDLLFHETTYTEEHKEKARERFHSTAAQAATVARDAGAAFLLTGHYSSRIKDLETLSEEARQFFPNVITNTEGLVTDITKLKREQ